MSRWFRFYTGVVDDPKAQMLPPKTFKNWVNVLCIAAQHDGELPPLGVIAFTLRMTESRVADILSELHSLNLLDKTETSFKPHNWDKRQYKTDHSDTTNAIRQKRHRERNRDVMKDLKALRDSSHEALRNVTAKRPDTETERISTSVPVERGLAEGRLALSAEAISGVTRRRQ